MDFINVLNIVEQFSLCKSWWSFSEIPVRGQHSEWKYFWLLLFFFQVCRALCHCRAAAPSPPLHPQSPPLSPPFHHFLPPAAPWPRSLASHPSCPLPLLPHLPRLSPAVPLFLFLLLPLCHLRPLPLDLLQHLVCQVLLWVRPYQTSPWVPDMI